MRCRLLCPSSFVHVYVHMLVLVLVLGTSACRKQPDERATAARDWSQSSSQPVPRPPPRRKSPRPGVAPQPRSSFPGLSKEEASIARRMMTFETYRRRVSGRPGLRFMTFRCGERRLYYAGFEHSLEPSDPKFKRLEEFWRNYLKDSKPGSRVVLIEGGRRPLHRSRSDAILKGGGEGGLVTLLAHDARIGRIESPEPDSRRQLARLAKRHGRALICYAYYARRVVLWHRYPVARRPPFEPFMGRSQVLRTLKCDLAAAAIDKAHRKLYSRPFDRRDAALFRRSTDPALGGSPISHVLRHDSLLRDLFLVQRLAHHWKARRAVFVVFGASHAVMQGPALQPLLCGACPGEPCELKRVGGWK